MKSRKVSLQSLSRNKDEKNHASSINKNHSRKSHEGTPIEQLSDIRLFNANKVHKGVLAKACKSQQRVESVLVRDETVDSDREWEKDLSR